MCGIFFFQTPAAPLVRCIGIYNLWFLFECKYYLPDMDPHWFPIFLESGRQVFLKDLKFEFLDYHSLTLPTSLCAPSSVMLWFFLDPPFKIFSYAINLFIHLLIYSLTITGTVQIGF